MVRLVRCKVHASSELQASTKSKNHHDMILNWRRTLRVLSCFGLNVNSVVGKFPRSGVVQAANEVRSLGAEHNSFAGALPYEGMRAMLAVSNFDIAQNSFTGMLPESGFREVTEFRIFNNRF
eukprot:3465419-Amphidinium_carterae.1